MGTNSVLLCIIVIPRYLHQLLGAGEDFRLCDRRPCTRAPSIFSLNSWHIIPAPCPLSYFCLWKLPLCREGQETEGISVCRDALGKAGSNQGCQARAMGSFWTPYKVVQPRERQQELIRRQVSVSDQVSLLLPLLCLWGRWAPGQTPPEQPGTYYSTYTCRGKKCIDQDKNGADMKEKNY